MRQITYPSSFTAFRKTARELLQQQVAPETILWSDSTTLNLSFEQNNAAQRATEASYFVARTFLDVAQTVACHRDPTKWERLYCILWKLTHGEKYLLHTGLDKDVVQCKRMAQAVRRDCHKMKAFVRFRQINDPTDPENPHFVAWFEPQHLIVKRMAGFFKQRFANMHWSILTPDDCVHWNQKQLFYAPGTDKSMAPREDDYETYWLTYYQNIFNPARLKTKAMCAEMPKKYWKNLPEAALIPQLIEKSMRMGFK